jgi:hypothetical protein
MIELSYIFDSYEGFYYNQYGAGPFSSTGGSYPSAGQLKDLTQFCNNCSNNNITSRFYFQIELPVTPTLGKLALDIEITTLTNCVSKDGAYSIYGSELGFGIFDSIPITGWASVLGDAGTGHLGPEGTGVYQYSHPRLLIGDYGHYGNVRENWTPTGDMSKYLVIEFSNNYRTNDVYYTIHGVYWKEDEPVPASNYVNMSTWWL